MKEQILKLRAEGRTYKEIKEILNCSKGTIAFHCGEGQKEKYKIRARKSRKVFRNYIQRRICFFQKRDDKNKGYEKDRKLTFTVDDFLKKFGIKTKCALTGIPINLEEDRNWQIDHICSKSKKGENTLDNCQILLTDINMMKHGLDEETLIKYCRLIIKNKKLQDREVVILQGS